MLAVPGAVVESLWRLCNIAFCDLTGCGAVAGVALLETLRLVVFCELDAGSRCRGVESRFGDVD
jgi:hypothetical protein